MPVDEVVVKPCGRPFIGNIAHHGEQNSKSCKPLLAINYQMLVHADWHSSDRHGHDGSHEVALGSANIIVVHDVFPQHCPFVLLPGLRPLEQGDHVLLCAVEILDDADRIGFHASGAPKTRATAWRFIHDYKV